MNETLLLAKTKLDGILLFRSEDCRDVNFDYFSGFRKPTFSFYLITKKNKIIAASSIDYERALNETKVDVVKLKDYNYKINKIIKKFFKGKRLGVIYGKMPLSIAKSLRGYNLVDIKQVASNIRAVKTKKEIGFITESCKIANKGIKFIEKNLNIDKREDKFVEELHNYLKKFKIDGFAFDTIITSGKKSAFIHPYPSFGNKKFSRGLGLIDFGIVYKGYCSDVTVPFCFGKLTRHQEDIKNAVIETFDLCRNYLKIGVKASDLFDVAKKFLNEKGFELKHGLGHGIGLEVHDSPSLSLNSEDVLKDNMVVTLEPGVYDVNAGGCRLENDFIISKKPKILTKSKFIEI